MTKEEKISEVMDLVTVIQVAAWDSGSEGGANLRYAKVIDRYYNRIKSKLR